MLGLQSTFTAFDGDWHHQSADKASGRRLAVGVALQWALPSNQHKNDIRIKKRIYKDSGLELNTAAQNIQVQLQAPLSGDAGERGGGAAARAGERRGGRPAERENSVKGGKGARGSAGKKGEGFEERTGGRGQGGKVAERTGGSAEKVEKDHQHQEEEKREEDQQEKKEDWSGFHVWAGFLEKAGSRAGKRLIGLFFRSVAENFRSFPSKQEVALGEDRTSSSFSGGRGHGWWVKGEVSLSPLPVWPCCCFLRGGAADQHRCVEINSKHHVTFDKSYLGSDPAHFALPPRQAV